MPTRKRKAEELPDINELASMVNGLRDELWKIRKAKGDPAAKRAEAPAEPQGAPRADLRVRIGHNIRVARERAQISQSDLARKLPKANPSRINNIEKGRVGVSLPYLEKIAKVLSVDISELFKVMALIALAVGLVSPVLALIYDPCPGCIGGPTCSCLF